MVRCPEQSLSAPRRVRLLPQMDGSRRKFKQTGVRGLRPLPYSDPIKNPSRLRKPGRVEDIHVECGVEATCLGAGDGRSSAPRSGRLPPLCFLVLARLGACARLGDGACGWRRDDGAP